MTMERFCFGPPDPRKLPAGPAEAFRQRHRVHALLAQCPQMDDERKAEAMRELLILGVAALPELRAAASSAEARTASLARRAIHRLVPDEIGLSLLAGLQREEVQYPVELGASLLARLRDPDLAVERVIRDLDRLTQKAARHISKRLQAPLDKKLMDEQPLEVLFGLGEFWRQEGFQGSQEDYHEDRNSWLPHVLKRRRGLPITLSVVFVALCRRLGLKADGVNMPVHFVVRVEVATKEGEGYVFIDPFSGARPLDLDDCRKLVESGGQAFAPEEHLKPAAPREVLIRMCHNLLGLYDQKSKPLEAERVATVLAYLTPGNPVPRLIRAERRLRRGAYRLAQEDLAEVLKMDPKSPLAGAAASLLRQIEYEHPF